MAYSGIGKRKKSTDKPASESQLFASNSIAQDEYKTSAQNAKYLKPEHDLNLSTMTVCVRGMCWDGNLIPELKSIHIPYLSDTMTYVSGAYGIKYIKKIKQKFHNCTIFQALDTREFVKKKISNRCVKVFHNSTLHITGKSSVDQLQRIQAGISFALFTLSQCPNGHSPTSQMLNGKENDMVPDGMTSELGASMINFFTDLRPGHVLQLHILRDMMIRQGINAIHDPNKPRGPKSLKVFFTNATILVHRSGKIMVSTKKLGTNASEPLSTVIKIMDEYVGSIHHAKIGTIYSQVADCEKMDSSVTKLMDKLTSMSVNASDCTSDDFDELFDFNDDTEDKNEHILPMSVLTCKRMRVDDEEEDLEDMLPEPTPIHDYM